MFAQTVKFVCIAFALACQATTVIAQSSSSGWPEKFYQPVTPLPPDLGLTYHHASTAAEGFLRGRAAVIHARGNYRLCDSQAAIQFEVARTLGQYNQRQWIAFCVANRERLDAERKKKVESLRLKNEIVRVSKLQAAYRLNEQQLERLTGTITWPQPLQENAYRENRLQLENLFRNANYNGFDQATAAHINRHVQYLQRALRRQVSEIDRTDYMNAQKFLCGLKYEPVFNAPRVTPEIQQGWIAERSAAIRQSYALVSN